MKYCSFLGTPTPGDFQVNVRGATGICRIYNKLFIV
jgi:hypothetical protein